MYEVINLKHLVSPKGKKRFTDAYRAGQDGQNSRPVNSMIMCLMYLSWNWKLAPLFTAMFNFGWFIILPSCYHSVGTCIQKCRENCTANALKYEYE